MGMFGEKIKASRLPVGTGPTNVPAGNDTRFQNALGWQGYAFGLDERWVLPGWRFGWTTGSTFTPAPGTMLYYPISVTNTQYFDSIGVGVTNYNSTPALRFAIWAADEVTGLPSQLVIDCGKMSIAATGKIYRLFTRTGLRGRYHVSILRALSNTAALYLAQADPADDIQNPLDMVVSDPSAAGAYSFDVLVVNGGDGSLDTYVDAGFPATAPAPTGLYESQNGYPPHFLLREVS